jgi:mono/diheme cytochrome c family protein
MRALCTMLLLTVGCGGNKDDGGGGGDSAAPTAPAGADLYEANCAVCHGDGGQGGAGPAFNDGSLDAIGDGDIEDAIRNGRPGMPSFSSFSDGEVANLVSFLRSEY